MAEPLEFDYSAHDSFEREAAELFAYAEAHSLVGAALNAFHGLPPADQAAPWLRAASPAASLACLGFLLSDRAVVDVAARRAAAAGAIGASLGHAALAALEARDSEWAAAALASLALVAAAGCHCHACARSPFPLPVRLFCCTDTVLFFGSLLPPPFSPLLSPPANTIAIPSPQRVRRPRRGAWHAWTCASWE